MQGTLRITKSTKSHDIIAEIGANLLDVLRNAGVVINAPCGGHGTCGKCVVHTCMGDKLACTTIIDEQLLNTEIVVPDTGGMSILAGYESLNPAKCDRNSQLPYGIAIDIGTTTLAFEMLDMRNGTRVATFSQANSQREFGADVMSRITNAVAGAHAALNAHILEDICGGVRHILDRAGVSTKEVELVAITGNTTMLHLLLDLPTDTLGVAPFTPVHIDIKRCRFSDIFGLGLLDCDIIILPGISTFVGADISAGMLCAGWPNITGNNLLIDLGTNGEMALFSRDKVVVTSTAAGPAFEGGNISMGVGSIPGAVAKVRYLPEQNVFSYETINDATPVGICGTGVVDISAELIRHGLVDETGTFESDEDEIIIAQNVTFTQRDVREIQLAKSAVRAGVEILLDIAGVKYNELSNVFVAGGFGHKIDIDNAITLGLIPAEFANRIVILGNSALGGCAKVLLSHASEVDILELVSISKEINLATHPRFNDMFMDYMGME